MKTVRQILCSATLVWFAVTAAAAQDVPADAFQIRYASNLAVGDSVVNMSNAGTRAGTDPAGNICVNVYAFDPAENMIACCACPVSPNALNSLSVRNDLIANTLTPAVPTSVIIKLLATEPSGGTCNASLPSSPNLAPGLRAWGTTLHANGSTSPVSYSMTETDFSKAALSDSELLSLTDTCSFIQSDGGGFGICRSCRTGGL